jgi:hypothetical protein
MFTQQIINNICILFFNEVMKVPVEWFLRVILKGLGSNHGLKTDWHDRGFSCFSQSLLANAEVVPQIRLRLLSLIISNSIPYTLSYRQRHYIVMDFINALPGNSSVNTVRHATVEEAVFCRTDRRASRPAE